MRQAPYEVPAARRIRVIIDTDCACEADDQFAVVHQLMTPKLEVVGITAAQFGAHFGAASAAESVRRSYDEICRLLELTGLTGAVPVLQGCAQPLPDEQTPVDSEASRFLVEQAMREDALPLFVVVQGALTNLASAYLLCPEIAGRLIAVWVGGGSYPGGEYEFNADNDIHAANVILDSPIELWQIPKDVYSTMQVSFAVLYDRVRPCGEIGRYLVDHMTREVAPGPMLRMSADKEKRLRAEGYSRGAMRCAYPGGEHWLLGDSAAVGLLLSDHLRCFSLVGAPRIEPDGCRYRLRPDNPRRIRVYHSVDRTFILEDFFAKLRYYFGS